MAMEYKIEWFRLNGPSQEGVYVHLLKDISCYMDIITKEEYSEAEEEDKCDLATNLFDVEGIVEVSLKAYRVYVIKAELFKWNDDLINEVLGVVADDIGESGFRELPGSKLRIENAIDRRDL